MSTAVRRITIEGKGWTFEARADEPLLQAAERAGIRLPSSCRNGTCRTCLCRLRGGSVSYRIEWPGLSLDEKREGYILACVALARDDLTIAAPAARLINPDGGTARA